MTAVSHHTTREPQRPAPAALAIAMLNTIGMTVLFGSETVFAALAFDWAGSGLLHISGPLLFAIGAVPIAAALYVTYRVGRATWRFERTAAQISNRL